MAQCPAPPPSCQTGGVGWQRGKRRHAHVTARTAAAAAAAPSSQAKQHAQELQQQRQQPETCRAAQLLPACRHPLPLAHPAAVQHASKRVVPLPRRRWKSPQSPAVAGQQQRLEAASGQWEEGQGYGRLGGLQNQRGRGGSASESLDAARQPPNLAHVNLRPVSQAPELGKPNSVSATRDDVGCAHGGRAPARHTTLN